MSKAESEAELQALLDEVTQARENLLSGKDFGLEGVHMRIDDACRNAMALPNEDVVELRDLMTALRDTLSDISTIMKEVEARLAEDEAADSGADEPPKTPSDDSR